MDSKTFKTSISLAFFIFLGCLQLSAQTKPHREVGLQFSSLNFNGGGFSAFYKKELKENVYRRVRFLAGNLNLGSTEEVFHFEISAGVAIGREKRKALDPKLIFYQGPEFGLGFRVQSLNETEFQSSINTSFGWVFGLQHSFNDRWAVNLETIPSASISFSGNTNNDIKSLEFNSGFSSAVSVGLLRKF